jgi:murein L,D-transpeptidase YcbB/YkuD
MKRFFRTLCVCLFSAVTCGVAVAQDDIRSIASQPVLRAGERPWDGSDWLARFYGPRNYAPAWTRGQADEAITLLRQAPADGLDADDYDPDGLQHSFDLHDQPDRFDAALTAAMLHFLADLRLGRVRSSFHTDGPDERIARFDPVQVLGAALDHGSVQEAVEGARPPLLFYERVRAVLARYRTLAAQPLHALPAPAGRTAPGGAYRAALALHARLVALGDLPTDAPAPDPHVYDDTLAEGVKHFQSRHGLTDSGVLDANTIAALNVPLAQRVRALELTLERLRWLPDLPSGPVVAVDLPAYRLWAFDRSQPEQAALEMRVIIGKAVKTQTPMFVGEMSYLEFNPYWNVPRSITVKEIIPKLARSPGYLASEHMELVGGGGASTAVDESTLAALRAGRLRVRQRPGPKNSLGAIKFAMPNRYDIYLHSTPRRELFQRTRRDLSHGCIRVEQPAELARFVLAGDPQWDLERIEAAMQPGRTRRVDLPEPVPVVLFYATAIAGRDGEALFARDIYHRDPLLEQALREHGGRSTRQIVPAPSGPTE